MTNTRIARVNNDVTSTPYRADTEFSNAAFNNNHFDKHFVGYRVGYELKFKVKKDKTFTYEWVKSPDPIPEPSDADYTKAEGCVRRGESDKELDDLAYDFMLERKAREKKLYEAKWEKILKTNPDYKKKVRKQKDIIDEAPAEQIMPGDMKIVQEITKRGKNVLVRQREI